MNICNLLTDLLRSELFGLTLVMGSYLLGIFLYKRLKLPIIQPLLISMIIIIVFLKTTGIDYSVFRNNTRFLNFMLGPSVVALGYVLYEQIYYLKGNIISILTAVFVGCIVGIVSVVGIAKLMGTDTQMLFSLAPKSVTTPIAISIAKNNHGIPELAVVFVSICGIFGGAVGAIVLRYQDIKSKVAKGLAMGTASHALGTVRAIEMGATEGAISGLAIGIMGIMTAMVIPFIEKILN